MNGRDSIDQEMQAAAPVGALCCECGTFRRGPAKGRHSIEGLVDPEYARKALAKCEASTLKWKREDIGYWRRRVEMEYAHQLTELKCATCGTVTWHARVMGSGIEDVTEPKRGGHPGANRVNPYQAEADALAILHARGIEVLESRAITCNGVLLDDHTVLLIKSGLTAAKRVAAFNYAVRMLDEDAAGRGDS